MLGEWNVDLFQFLLVRLRVISAVSFISMGNRFQFLLVRLRDDFVSTAGSYVIVFQFLLVRLRELVVFCSRSNIRYISIPSGAIKRQKDAATESATVIFQFLLVRLRVSFKNIYLYGWNEFQFLLVRLREQGT